MTPAAGPVTPAAALRATGGFARGARVLRRLHAAPVKSSWLVERGGERFVLRADTPLAATLGLDRVAEFRLLQAAARAGLAAPPVLVSGPAPAVMVTRYAPGAAWRAADLGGGRRLERLAGLLRAVHEAGLPPAGPGLRAAVAHYAAQAGTPAARALAARAARALDPGGRPVVTCHRDPIAGNVVGLRHPVLIDWEYAGPAEPLFDLAVTLEHHRLPAAAARTLLAAWSGGRGGGTGSASGSSGPATGTCGGCGRWPGRGAREPRIWGWRARRAPPRGAAPCHKFFT